MSPEGFALATGVSRGTLEKLKLYHGLLEKWQARVNLVGRASLAAAWRRHFLDSAQLFPLLRAARRAARGTVLIDLGSGAGFPGLVLAIMAAGENFPLATTLVESDARKASFLAEIAAVTGVAGAVAIEVARLESLRCRRPLADILTARALAPLAELLALASPLLAEDGICLFLKGAKAGDELTAAAKTWKMRWDRIPSRSDPSGVILRVQDIRRA
ncbi:MAG: 16S rRNA (guanine(527)-N(7))-methyltransferase RsmG [Pseudomonadota bacterium]